jgi:hypothetical protein
MTYEVTARMLRSARAPTRSPVSEAEIAYEVAERLLAEYRPRVRSVRYWMALNSAAKAFVAEAAERDADRAARREQARYWREHPAMAGLSEET